MPPFAGGTETGDSAATGRSRGPGAVGPAIPASAPSGSAWSMQTMEQPLSSSSSFSSMLDPGNASSTGAEEGPAGSDRGLRAPTSGWNCLDPTPSRPGRWRHWHALLAATVAPAAYQPTPSAGVGSSPLCRTSLRLRGATSGRREVGRVIQSGGTWHPVGKSRGGASGIGGEGAGVKAGGAAAAPAKEETCPCRGRFRALGQNRRSPAHRDRRSG